MLQFIRGLTGATKRGGGLRLLLSVSLPLGLEEYRL